jgi:hypothetical protein
MEFGMPMAMISQLTISGSVLSVDRGACFSMLPCLDTLNPGATTFSATEKFTPPALRQRTWIDPKFLGGSQLHFLEN